MLVCPLSKFAVVTPVTGRAAPSFIGYSSGPRLTEGLAGSGPEMSFAMKTPLVVALAMAVVLGAGSALAAMNYACKSSHHSWCAPSFNMRHHAKVSYLCHE
jgi:hypothetical protein